MNEESAETVGVFIIRPNKKVDGNFISYYTKGNNNQRYKLSTKAQGLTIVHLYYQSIKDETSCISKFNEQKNISSVFMKWIILSPFINVSFYAFIFFCSIITYTDEG